MKKGPTRKDKPTMIKSYVILASLAIAVVVSALTAGSDQPRKPSTPTQLIAPVVITAPTTLPQPLATTTVAPSKPVAQRKSVATTAAPTTTTTYPAEMPVEIAEAQTHIPDFDASEEMQPGQCEWIYGCDASPEEATDWVESAS